jgi:catechol 2,3-dioxygenase-like lactoylglutathione lyase family enzyme
MIGYVTVGTNDFEAAIGFYDSVFASVGIQRQWRHGNMAAWGRRRAEPTFCIASPFDELAASVGNGGMIALRMESREDVDTLHAACLAHGGTDAGAPGPRGEHGFYGGYFRDLDGNKLNAYVPG